MTIERDTKRLTLAVPCTLGVATRYARLRALLERERWTLVAAPTSVAGNWGGCTPEQAQATELRFIRDYLGPLRARAGPVPEKVPLACAVPGPWQERPLLQAARPHQLCAPHRRRWWASCWALA